VPLRREGVGDTEVDIAVVAADAEKESRGYLAERNIEIVEGDIVHTASRLATEDVVLGGVHCLRTPGTSTCTKPACSIVSADVSSEHGARSTHDAPPTHSSARGVRPVLVFRERASEDLRAVCYDDEGTPADKLFRAVALPTMSTGRVTTAIQQ
jgi:hypothetical protein